MNKRKVILIGIFGLLVICLYVSISYSYYLIGNDKVEIETAMESPSCVGISIDSGEAFSLNGDYAVPITNAQFLNSKPETQDIYKYSFTITNSCDGQDLNGLTIGLVPLDGSDLPISNLRYILIKSDENTNSFTEDNIKEFTDETVKKLPQGMMQQLSNSYGESATNVYPVGSTSLSGTNPVSYDLYVWIDSSGGNETMDQTFNAAVVLYDEETILDVLLKSNPGDGELIHHTEDLPNSAGDDGYRYSGDDPNNFICFGIGSERYNRGEENTCPIKNKYRIIGYVPVTLADEKTKTSLIKVIKAEYLTEDEFGEKEGDTEYFDIYDSIERIESSLQKFPTYKWNDIQNSNWQESSLYALLNSQMYINKNFGREWKDKIEEVTWNVGGASDYSIISQAMYNEEMNTIGPTSTVKSQIGLMYAYDYGFASSSNNWQFALDKYNNGEYSDTKNNNLENNWLFNGVREWTISPKQAGYVFWINGGSLDFAGGVTLNTVAIRPVFYLKQDVGLIKDKIANGSKSHPFRIPVGEEERELVSPQLETLLNTSAGDQGEFLQHTPELEDGAGDYGYRYSGNEPNNFICFGIGSEDYNNGKVGEKCDIKNKYRIIGYVPVTLADGKTKTSLIKVIKAEYLTNDELESSESSAYYDGTYSEIKRIESDYSELSAFIWNDSPSDWGENKLYKSLNSNPYLSSVFGDTWLNKIETVTWNVGRNYRNKMPKYMYNYEMTSLGVMIQVPAQIGLMYTHDYGFASSRNNWKNNLDTYYTEDNRNNNWLFNGVYEWTIAVDSIGDSINRIFPDGELTFDYFSEASSVRPVFYLKSDVSIINDGTAIGTKEHPLRIAI